MAELEEIKEIEEAQEIPEKIGLDVTESSQRFFAIITSFAFILEFLLLLFMVKILFMKTFDPSLFFIFIFILIGFMAIIFVMRDLARNEVTKGLNVAFIYHHGFAGEKQSEGFIKFGKVIDIPVRDVIAQLKARREAYELAKKIREEGYEYEYE
ncbi:MAG: hypothetical protein QXT31_07465 [Candidatus Bathyarchaeia archaeon]